MQDFKIPGMIELKVAILDELLAFCVVGDRVPVPVKITVSMGESMTRLGMIFNCMGRTNLRTRYFKHGIHRGLTDARSEVICGVTKA